MGPPAQATPHTDALLQAVDDGAVLEVPVIWPLEVANALLVLTRRKRLSDAERLRALAAIQAIAPKVDAESVSLALTKLSRLAADCHLSVYDASYLELAKRKRLALACKDGPLRDAAKACGLKVV